MPSSSGVLLSLLGRKQCAASMLPWQHLTQQTCCCQKLWWMAIRLMILGIICCTLPDWTDPLDWALALLGSLYSTKLLSSSSPSSEANDSSACVDQQIV